MIYPLDVLLMKHCVW
ncbi:unnamed protein product [Larinioides sclopetarius]|uniref:Uncharacterized protein n=1 Tax=Larinioides sclopetarius TaxID=280406 RepID=A0AAV1YUI8_9ARAC